MTGRVERVLLLDGVDAVCGQILTEAGISVTTHNKLSKEQLLKEVAVRNIQCYADRLRVLIDFVCHPRQEYRLESAGKWTRKARYLSSERRVVYAVRVLVIHRRCFHSNAINHCSIVVTCPAAPGGHSVEKVVHKHVPKM